MEEIQFFSEDTSFELQTPEQVSNWISRIVQSEDQEIAAINFIFCSDNYLLEVNRTYLNHDYFTDIITFDQREYDDDPLESDIFISIDRVKENAEALSNSFETELHRVIIHGVLHLLGWNDKSDDEKQAMREKEEACLSLLPKSKT